MVAPTGKAADNLPFLCETIHGAFSLSPTSNLSNLELSNRKISILKEKFENVTHLVIEEYSMIGCRLFSAIDYILKTIFNDQLCFGGLSVLLCGDIGQLLPVNDIPIWCSPLEDDIEIVRRAKEIFSFFNINYTLTEVMRQQGTAELEFKNFLSRVRKGVMSEEDYDFIKEKFSNNIEDLHLTTNNRNKDLINERKLFELDKPVFFIDCLRPNNCNAPTQFNENGISNRLLLCIGQTVMLTRNLSIEAGLVNGTIGVIVDFVKITEDEFLDRIDYVIVRFGNYKGSTIIKEDDDKLVPVKREAATNGYLNFPLISASSLTIHKSQGSTFDFKVSVDIGDKEAMGSSFVAFSRVKRFCDLVIKPFDWDRFYLIGQGKYIGERAEAMEKLERIEFEWN